LTVANDFERQLVPVAGRLARIVANGSEVRRCSSLDWFESLPVIGDRK